MGVAGLASDVVSGSRIGRFLRRPVHRDGLALVSSSALSSLVGLLYWVIAARLFPPAEVGVGSALVSTLMLLGSVGHLNLGVALLRFVPVAGGQCRALVIGCYLTGRPCWSCRRRRWPSRCSAAPGVLAPRWGLTGVGAALLIAETLAAAAVLVACRFRPRL